MSTVARLVHIVRGGRILLDADLAGLYGVSTAALNRAVKRNAGRFPDDFMFMLTTEERDALKCQIGISKSPARGGRRIRPHAFTEQGIAMLSSVLRSPRAVEVARKIEAMEKKYDEHFAVVFDAIKRLIAEDEVRRASPKRRIGFVT